MVQQDLPVPPEADVIRLARLAARMSVDEAVARVREAGGRIGPTYWRDIERGHGGRRGQRVPARASDGLLAQMADAVGVTPSQLAGAGRADAARVLEAMRAGPPPPRPMPAAIRGTASGEEMAPYLEEVRRDLGDAVARHGPSVLDRSHPRGRDIFRLAHEIGAWNDPDMPDEWAVWTIANTRRLTALALGTRERRTGLRCLFRTRSARS
jgi:hypothetical protein